MECCSGNGLVLSDGGIPGGCHWDAVPTDCPTLATSWQHRLMCLPRWVLGLAL